MWPYFERFGLIYCIFTRLCSQKNHKRIITCKSEVVKKVIKTKVEERLKKGLDEQR